MKVLVIDDEQLVRWFLERALKRWSFDVVSATGANEALKLLETHTFDLVFTDLKMPSGSGSIIVEKVSEMKDPPKLIVCSAYITDEMEDEYKNKGIAILKKPFKLDELEDSLKTIIPD